jgi:hypothetical protein
VRHSEVFVRGEREVGNRNGRFLTLQIADTHSVWLRFKSPPCRQPPRWTMAE